MAARFRTHYTRDQARALLPQVRIWLSQLHQTRAHLAAQEERLRALLGDGADVGGALVHRWLQLLLQLKAVIQEFESRDIQLKDLDRGLLDFPSFRDGREVFLCWEEGEDDVDHWHHLDAGYAGRTPFAE